MDAVTSVPEPFNEPIRAYAPDSPERVPSVSPDGLWVLFQSKRFGSWDIFRIPLGE